MHWLLLRGLSREQRHWGVFPEIFRAAMPEGTRTHFLDLPGTGTELRRDSPTSVRDIMEDLRARWIAIQAANQGPWGLLAMSLGGMIAMEWCHRHPGDFTRLVLSNTSASDIGRPWDRMSPRALATVVRAMLERDPVARERLVLSMVTQRRGDLDELAKQWADIHASSPVTRATVARQLRAAIVYRAPARLSTPVLIIAAARHALASPACGRALAERFRAPFELHPGGGHELALDAPDWMAERIAGWVSASSPASTDAHRAP